MQHTKSAVPVVWLFSSFTRLLKASFNWKKYIKFGSNSALRNDWKYQSLKLVGHVAATVILWGCSFAKFIVVISMFSLCKTLTNIMKCTSSFSCINKILNSLHGKIKGQKTSLRIVFDNGSRVVSFTQYSCKTPDELLSTYLLSSKGSFLIIHNKFIETIPLQFDAVCTVRHPTICI